MRILLILLVTTAAEADKKFQWKMIKSNVHDRLTQFGTISVCGIAKGVEPRKSSFIFLFFSNS